jgi:hypothetical protein
MRSQPATYPTIDEGLSVSLDPIGYESEYLSANACNPERPSPVNAFLF